MKQLALEKISFFNSAEPNAKIPFYAQYNPA
jgi:hypothetical protein